MAVEGLLWKYDLSFVRETVRMATFPTSPIIDSAD